MSQERFPDDPSAPQAGQRARTDAWDLDLSRPVEKLASSFSADRDMLDVTAWWSAQVTSRRRRRPPARAILLSMDRFHQDRSCGGLSGTHEGSRRRRRKDSASRRAR